MPIGWDLRPPICRHTRAGTKEFHLRRLSNSHVRALLLHLDLALDLDFQHATSQAARPGICRIACDKYDSSVPHGLPQLRNLVRHTLHTAVV